MVLRWRAPRAPELRHKSGASNNPGKFPRYISLSNYMEKLFCSISTTQICHVLKYTSQLNFKMAFIFLYQIITQQTTSLHYVHNHKENIYAYFVCTS